MSRVARARVDRLLVLSHLVLGVALGGYFSLIGVTGSVLVFAPEISAASTPAVQPRPAGLDLPLDEVIDRISAAHPGWRINRLRWFPEREDRYRVTLASRTGGEIDQVVFVDRRTGRVIGSDPRWLRLVTELHYTLLGGKPGQKINGIGAALLGAVAVTGLLAWWRWPARQQWLHRVFSSGVARGRFTGDMHRLTGLAVTAMLLAISISGVYFAYPDRFRQATGWLAPPKSTVRSDLPPLDLDTMRQRASAVLADGIATAVYPPASPTDPLRFRVKRAADSWEFGRSEIYFDQYSGQLLGAIDAVEAPLEQRAGVLWMALVHYGRFGGLVTRVLWVVVGMAPSFLFVTGLMMWTTRRRRQGARESQTA
jgi:uncharacterized iron-regulated membrane protein